MLTYVFDKDGRCVALNCSQNPTAESYEGEFGPGLTLVPFDSEPHPGVLNDYLRLVGGQVVVDPSWQPPPPPIDQLALLTQTVAQNVGSSVHDKRFMRQKEVGKTAIAWIKAHPTCTPDEAEAYVMDLVLAAIPGEPVIPKLYFEYKGTPQGLAMSYLYEVIQRGYMPEGTPIAWQSIVGLIVATPDDKIAEWLRSL
jgi:hypothetical protein